MVVVVEAAAGRAGLEEWSGSAHGVVRSDCASESWRIVANRGESWRIVANRGDFGDFGELIDRYARDRSLQLDSKTDLNVRVYVLHRRRYNLSDAGSHLYIMEQLHELALVDGAAVIFVEHAERELVVVVVCPV